MVKHTCTIRLIRLQQPTNRLIVFDHFVGSALKGLNLHYVPFVKDLKKQQFICSADVHFNK